MSKKIRILLADDHAVVRGGLRQFLADTDDLEITAEAASGLLTAAFLVAIASGAVLGGLLVDHVGGRAPIGYMAVASFVGALLVLFVGKEPQRS